MNTRKKKKPKYSPAEEMERSDYFPIHNPPKIPGVYEVLPGGTGIPQMMEWTGTRWVDLETQQPAVLSWALGDKWRGLKEKP